MPRGAATVSGAATSYLHRAATSRSLGGHGSRMARRRGCACELATLQHLLRLLAPSSRSPRDAIARVGRSLLSPATHPLSFSFSFLRFAGERKGGIYRDSRRGTGLRVWSVRRLKAEAPPPAWRSRDPLAPFLNCRQEGVVTTSSSVCFEVAAERSWLLQPYISLQCCSNRL